MDEGQVKPEPDIQMGGAGGKNTLAAILSYIGPLVIVSYVIGKDDPFSKFHIRQGLVLLVGWVVLWVLAWVPFFWYFGLGIVWTVVRLGLLILAVIGVINAAQGKEKELPLIGQYAKYFKF